MIARTATRLALALSLPALLAPIAGAGQPAPATAVPASGGDVAVRSAGVEERISGVAGKVSDHTAPLSSVRVYLYRLNDLELSKAETDARGHFSFDTLPAGLYKVIAHKPGFLPAVVQLTRTTAKAYQFLELELSEAGPEVEAAEEDDFWSLRAEVPTDVLREIQLAEIQQATRMAASGSGNLVAPPRMATEMRASTGVDELGAGREGQVTRGQLGVRGRVGEFQLGVTGDYVDLQPGVGTDPSGAPSGFARALSLSVANDQDMMVRLSSRTDRLVAGPEQHGESVDFENYRLAVSHNVGERGRSDFVAQYTSESNFHRHGWIDPQTIPEASRSWRLEGTYTAALTERSSLQTGIRYRERTSAFGFGEADVLAPDQQRVDLFGRAGMQVRPSVLVEYGLYTTMRDGSLSLSPRGGLVLQVTPTWQAAGAASYKVHDEAETQQADYFMPTLRLADDSLDDSCEQNEAHCYQLMLTHQQGEDENLSIGATHRRFDETQRLYFSEELIDRYDSLFLVPGDEIPELRMTVTRRLSPKVLARLESNLGEGGGGVFYATDDSAYENDVRYLVTSLDTRFAGTATGVFVAFHHLQQSLHALGSEDTPAPRLEVERLEVMLTQDLNILLDIATDMALQLNMQLSRGSWPFLAEASQEDREELRKRLLGGIAFRF